MEKRIIWNISQTLILWKYKESTDKIWSENMTTRVEIAKNFAKRMKSDKIKLMILFESVARWDDNQGSDIDILVVSNYHKEIWPKISDIIVETIAKERELLSIHVMREDVFNETKDYSFLTNVLKEGMILEWNWKINK